MRAAVNGATGCAVQAIEAEGGSSLRQRDNRLRQRKNRGGPEDGEKGPTTYGVRRRGTQWVGEEASEMARSGQFVSRRRGSRPAWRNSGGHGVRTWRGDEEEQQRTGAAPAEGLGAAMEQLPTEPRGNWARDRRNGSSSGGAWSFEWFGRPWVSC